MGGGTMNNEVLQLLVDALRALLAGGPDGAEQAKVKVDRAQQVLSRVEVPEAVTPHDE
jgi:hypothetical protein